MTILGISAGFHDAAVSLINNSGDILFAGHSERYSKIKNDLHLNNDIIKEALEHGTPNTLAYYERPWMKKILQLYSGQYHEALNTSNLTLGQYLRKHISNPVYLKPLLRCSRKYMSHHLSHAAGGFQTSPFDEAAVVVIDAIGELDTISIYRAWYDSDNKANYQRVWRQGYPHSIGLFYSSLTQQCGLHPMDEEYITMGMSGWGDSRRWASKMYDRFIQNFEKLEFKDNLHLGWPEDFAADARPVDLAAAGQFICENLISQVMMTAAKLVNTKNLVYMGGVALNCLANRNLGDYFDNIWIMPCPGDAGSSLGAAALAYGKRINWSNAYLGHDIPGNYPVNDLLAYLSTFGIVGVASGRAEFGPRAFGQRSLLADPRGPEIKDQVNEIKRRQKFRPFAPVILEELVDDYFDMPRGFSNSRYMQVVARCRHPDLFPAIIHVDGTSRVQTVPNDGSGIRQLLEAWYKKTGCPMLLNTSLNIRGEPMVNDRADADRFETLYGIKVFS
jgi:carbamoyltransferase